MHLACTCGILTVLQASHTHLGPRGNLQTAPLNLVSPGMRCTPGDCAVLRPSPFIPLKDEDELASTCPMSEKPYENSHCFARCGPELTLNTPVIPGQNPTLDDLPKHFEAFLQFTGAHAAGEVSDVHHPAFTLYKHNQCSSGLPSYQASLLLPWHYPLGNPTAGQCPQASEHMQSKDPAPLCKQLSEQPQTADFFSCTFSFLYPSTASFQLLQRSPCGSVTIRTLLRIPVCGTQLVLS